MPLKSLLVSRELMLSSSSPSPRRLSIRVRLSCAFVFVVGSFLPPYIPGASLAFEEEDFAAPQFLFVEDGFLLKTSSLGLQGARLAYSESMVHTVKSGESLERLTQRYGISVQTIQWANDLEPGAPIHPGQELMILPVDGVLHTVRRGQTLLRIAQLYEVPLEDVARQNKIEGGFIVADQQLIIPGGKPIIAGQKLRFGENLPGDLAAKVQPPLKAPKEATVPGAVAALTHGVLQLPCAGCLYTQYYRAGHYGVDLQTRGGGHVLAAEAGTVIRADYGWHGGYGNVIEVNHGNGLVTLYAHNKAFLVEVGDRVQRGQAIAEMGNTGRVYGQTGIHVHFEVHVNGVKRNPLLYLQ